jgi:hypothetical protein
MMKKIEDDASYYSRNRALKTADLNLVAVRGNVEESVDSTLTDIGLYIQWCHEFSCPPLPHLRKYFPDFEWKFHEVETATQVARIIEKVDYAILEGNGSDWSMGFYTATQKDNRGKKKICFCFDGLMMYTWPFKELVAVDATVLIVDHNLKLNKEFEAFFATSPEAVAIEAKYVVQVKKGFK